MAFEIDTLEEQEYDMTTVRIQHNRETRKWPWVTLAIVMLCIAGFFVFHPTLQKDGQIRGNPTDSDTNTAEQKQENAPKKENNAANSNGARDITFELSNLDGEEGATGTFVVRTHPEWSPLGVEQFHVSHVCV